MKKVNGQPSLRVDHLAALLSSVSTHLRVTSGNRGLTFWNRAGDPIGGINFKGKGRIDWHDGPLS
jgi:hypothetical protein